MDCELPAAPTSPPAAPSEPEPGPKARRKKRRGGFGGKPVRKPPKPTHADCQPPRERSPDQRIAEVDTRDMQRLDRLPRITEQLSELWADNYDASVEREMQENDAMGMTQAAWLMQYVAPRSTYQLNNRQSAELATVREARDQRMRRKWAASARHANNQRDTPFSMLARSIGMLGRRVSRKSWLEDKSLMSKTRAEHYLSLLVPLRQYAMRTPPLLLSFFPPCAEIGWCFPETVSIFASWCVLHRMSASRRRPGLRTPRVFLRPGWRAVCARARAPSSVRFLPFGRADYFPTRRARERSDQARSARSARTPALSPSQMRTGTVLVRGIQPTIL